jgi:cathepsin A (carboxypeptidase C)
MTPRKILLSSGSTEVSLLSLSHECLLIWGLGPGCSSLTGLFMELGPSRVNKAGSKPLHNPYSWNNNASVIFLDQPINVGYSYGDDSVSDTVAAGKDVYALLVLFFKQFPEYKDLEFHIAGESYAGHYIPVFASGKSKTPARV